MKSPLQSVLPFTKMEGLGNDYVYVLEKDLPYLAPDLSTLAARLSDRHFGVGGDGLVLIGAASGADADFTMRIFNSDGSEAEMCGNAIRCVGKFVHDKGLTEKTALRVATPSGIKDLYLRREHGVVQAVRVAMGVPRLAPEDVFMTVEGESFINREISADGRIYSATAVSMGNPHLVVAVPDPDALDLPRLGPLDPARV